MKKSLAIIPAWNESENILSVVEDIRSNCPLQIDVLVIDDCSDDETVAILQKHNIPYLSLIHHLGIGAGVQAGYRYALQAGYDIAIQFDGDGQHDAAYLEALLQPIIDDTADYTIGSRFIEMEGFQSSHARRAGIRFLSFLIRLLAGVTVRDVTSGMRAVNRPLIRLFVHAYAQDYAEPEALVYAGREGARILEIPVKMRERQRGRSSITLLRSAYYMVKVSLALLLTGRNTRRKQPAERRKQ